MYDEYPVSERLSVDPNLLVIPGWCVFVGLFASIMPGDGTRFG